MTVSKGEIAPSYKRESGLWVLKLEDVKLPEGFDESERSIVYIPLGEVGGNHRHPRREAIIGIGDLELVWIDENEKKHRELMNKNGKLTLFVVSAMTPHAVRNTSSKNFGMLLEFASEPQHDVELVDVA